VLLALPISDAEGPVEVEVVGFDRATRRREHEWPDQFLTVEASAFVLVILGSLQAAGEIERRLPRKAEYVVHEAQLRNLDHAAVPLHVGPGVATVMIYDELGPAHFSARREHQRSPCASLETRRRAGGRLGVRRGRAVHREDQVRRRQDAYDGP